MPKISRPMIVAAAVTACAAFVAVESFAVQGFKMKMEKTARTAWDKSFNKLVNEPFNIDLPCAAKAKIVVPQGKGCIELGEKKKMCCDSWKITVACVAGKWEQSDIDADNCKTVTPAPAPTP